MLRNCSLALGVALAVALLAPPRLAAGQVTEPFFGIRYSVKEVNQPRPLRMHVAQIDLTAPGIRFKVSPPGGDREVVRQSTLDFLTQEHAQLAINAHYFLPFPSEDKTAWIIGLGASEGNVFSAFETPEQRYALVVDAPAINIDRDNQATVVHRDPMYADGTHVLEKATLWNVVAGSSQIVTDGQITVPVYSEDPNLVGALLPGGPNNYSNAKAWPTPPPRAPRSGCRRIDARSRSSPWT